ncbi:Aminoglycoside phosphotransferase [Penicillium italicum]|uniref:Altered inheritance of mitochondria protein 9, mitochondrial n=1 Tax=Penicillium italicum TaxID=40296 RepID=A0A0A2LDF3_PENIT|nr:Aminoglycoside phosphotransferase [Penicillium italicum]
MKFFSASRLGRQLCSPELYAETQNGQDENISEEDLHRYTRHRWLFNEEKELSKRYVEFDLQQLVQVAISVCEGAQFCIKVTKCAEGLHNKAFILTMDNGCEVFAKLPNPNAGAARLTTASEIATRKLLSEVLKLPVPRVLAWSFDAAGNHVGAEYIIEEKAPGVRLGSVWNRWPRNSKLQLITQVIDIQNTLTGVTFDRHGCIYFKDDLRSLGEEPEKATIQSATTSIPDIFAIGPLTTGELWNGVRSGMNLDRGPWKNPSDYTRALGLNEIAYIKPYAISRMNYYRSLKTQEHPEDGLALLTKYMKVAPYLIPQSTNEAAFNEAASNNVLMHPDLHLDNIFVDPDTLQITRIVDWQSACVAPLFYHADVPRMCSHRGPLQEGWVVPERPEDFDSLSAEEQRQVDDDLESQILHKYYEAQVYKRSPRYWSALQDKSIPIIRKPVWLVTGVWENRDLFFLRESLMSLFAQWEELVPGVPCPISFTNQDVELHSKEEENIKGVGKLLTLLRDESVLPVDGMVQPKDYDTAQKNSRKFKDIFIGLAKDDEEKELFTKLWPYQESADTECL